MTKCDVQSAVQEINDQFLPKDVASTSSSMRQVRVPATVAEQNLALEGATEGAHDQGGNASFTDDIPPRTPTYNPEAPGFSPRRDNSPEIRDRTLDSAHSQTSGKRNLMISNPNRITMFANNGNIAPSVLNPTAPTAASTSKPKMPRTSSIPKKDADASRNVVEQNPRKKTENADLLTNVGGPVRTKESNLHVSRRPPKSSEPPAKKSKVVTTVSTSKDASSQREPRKSGNDKGNCLIYSQLL